MASTTTDDARIPVWIAFSDLYLDTEVSLSHDDIVRILATSPYSLDELREMLMYDVHLALYPNPMNAAGEWAGFEEIWLLERIAAIRRQLRWRRRISMHHIGMQWTTLAAMIRAARSAAAQS